MHTFQVGVERSALHACALVDSWVGRKEEVLTYALLTM